LAKYGTGVKTGKVTEDNESDVSIVLSVSSLPAQNLEPKISAAALRLELGAMTMFNTRVV